MQTFSLIEVELKMKVRIEETANRLPSRHAGKTKLKRDKREAARAVLSLHDGDIQMQRN